MAHPNAPLPAALPAAPEAAPGAAAPPPAMPADVQAFESVLDGLDAVAPQGPSALTSTLGQVQERVAAAYDLASMPALPADASFAEAMQYTTALNARLASGQQAMTVMHGLAQKVEKAVEALLPKTG